MQPPARSEVANSKDTAVECQQDDLGAMGRSLRATPGESHRLQQQLLTLGDDDLGCHPWHDISSSRTISRPAEKMAK